MKQVLIVDDDVAVTNYLMVFLVQTGEFEPDVVNDSRDVEGFLLRNKYDVVLLDMDMPNVSGMDILENMRSGGDGTPVVVLTGVSDVDLAVGAMKLGALDYLIKPVDDDKLVEVLNSSIEHGVLHRSISELPVKLTREELTHGDAFENFVTQDQNMIRLFHQAEKIASGDLSIFIWGEFGTGKEAVARAIHNASKRRDFQFIAVEADSRDPGQFPAFFFGQDRDYSGRTPEGPGFLEEADRGTIFLDNIDALSHPMQVRLKRLIQSGEYYRENSTRIRTADVRIVASSKFDLTSPDYQDRFSRDLLYHLMVNSIRIPSLRERRIDIPLLAQSILEEEAPRAGKSVISFDEDCLEFLGSYHFPGNIHELRAIIAAALVIEEKDIITLESMPAYMKVAMKMGVATVGDSFHPRKLDSVIRDHVARTLDHYGNDTRKAAEELGISTDDLDRLLSVNGAD